MVGRVRTCSVTFLLVLLATALLCPIASASQGTAQNSISTAQDAVKKCYDSLQQAQSAGANVTALMDTLNDAAALLSNADLAYASGDYDSAYRYATQSQSKLAGFADQANAQAQAALTVHAQNETSILLSLVAAAAILLGGIAAWIALRTKEGRISLHGSTAV